MIEPQNGGEGGAGEETPHVSPPSPSRLRDATLPSRLLRWRSPTLAAILAACLAVAVGITAAIAAGSFDDGRIGPARHLLGDGRSLRPAGTLVALGNFPTGGALTPDGKFYWTVSTGRGFNDIRIVSLRSRRVVQVIPIPGGSGGIAMDPRHQLAYVSGVADSQHADEQRPGLPGRQGDVIDVYRYESASGQAHLVNLIPVPAPSSSPVPQGIADPPGFEGPPQSFPPTSTKRVAWPDRLAVSADGSTLLVPLNLADEAAIVDTATGVVRYVSTGHYPYGAAILADGRTGLVSNETSGTVSVIDLRSGAKREDIQVGAPLSHPEAITLDPRAPRAYVAIANSDQVAVIDTRSLSVQATLSVERPAGIGSAPVALSVTPDGRRLLVAEEGANEISVFGLPGSVAAVSAAARRARLVLGHEAVVSAARAGAHTDGGRQRVDVANRPGVHAASAFPLIGRVPTAAFPTDVEAAAGPCAGNGRHARSRRRRHHRHTNGRRPAPVFTAGARTSRARPAKCLTLVYIAAKALGVGANPQGPVPTSPLDSDDQIRSHFRYLPAIVSGDAGILSFPTDASIRSLTPVAERQLSPSNTETAPANTPLRPGGPIKHVFFIVRENRTYDQDLGDLGSGDSDPGLSLFGKSTTPNLHALVTRFPLVDHVYANSEASIDGHFWTSAAKVSDYVQKNWFQNYAARGRPYDFGTYAVTFPPNGFLFDQAARQGISYFNYGEAIAGLVPLPDKDASPQVRADEATKFAHSDLGAGTQVGVGATPVGQCYPNDADINRDAITGNPTYDSTPPAGADPRAESRFDCFKQRFAAQLASTASVPGLPVPLPGQLPSPTGVPTFNYLVLSNDHTVGTTPGERSPRALVADNDYGTGQVVDAISHSSIWKSSAIFVIEDDSQDGADHVDAHRIPAAVISPYAKRGAIVHTRYDFLSVIRSMELIMGMHPLGLFDSLATPMYDAFQSTPANGEPYDAIVPSQSRLETNSIQAANARLSRSLNFRVPDQIPQLPFDRILWQSVHGANSQPPPPGPDATPGG